jgi:hypothetical protein
VTAALGLGAKEAAAIFRWLSYFQQKATAARKIDIFDSYRVVTRGTRGSRVGGAVRRALFRRGEEDETPNRSSALRASERGARSAPAPPPSARPREPLRAAHRGSPRHFRWSARRCLRSVALGRGRAAIGPSRTSPRTGGGHLQPARQHPRCSATRTSNSSCSSSTKTSSASTDTGRRSAGTAGSWPAADLSRSSSASASPARRYRASAPAQPARSLRHRPTRRGSRNRAPARPTDDVLPESTGRPPNDKQTRQRHRPPPNRQGRSPATASLYGGELRDRPTGFPTGFLIA